MNVRTQFPHTNRYIEVQDEGQKAVFESIMSREFFDDVHWLLDSKGANRVKYNIEWFSPCYVSTQGGFTLNVLRCWEDGKTGFPLVDACMREVRVTGYKIYPILLSRIMHFDMINEV